MSSIIDALKKSDQNRNGDQVSQINNIKLGDQAKQSSKRGFWLLLFVLLIIAGGVLAWQQGWHHSAINYLKSWSSQSTDKQASTNKQMGATEPVTQSKPNNPQATANNQLLPPKQSDIKAQSKQVKMKQDKPGLVEKPETAVITPVDKTNNSKSQQIEPLKQASQNTQLSQTNKPAEKNKDSSDNNQTVSKNTETSMQPTLQQDYFLLHQLDFSIRKNIPPVKLNIHIFDPNPDKRMVLINGEKYSIGDLIADVITVEDITKEGVIVKFQEYNILIPK